MLRTSSFVSDQIRRKYQIKSVKKRMKLCRFYGKKRGRVRYFETGNLKGTSSSSPRFLVAGAGIEPAW